MFAYGKRILIHRKRSPFPYLGKVNCIRNINKNRLKYGDSGVFVSETIKLCCYKINNRLRSLPSLREGRGTAAAVDEYALYFFKQFDKSPFKFEFIYRQKAENVL